MEKEVFSWFIEAINLHKIATVKETQSERAHRAQLEPNVFRRLENIDFFLPQFIFSHNYPLWFMDDRWIVK